MAHGTVTWFDPLRGMGAITLDDGGHDAHVHSSDIDGGGRQSLTAGDHVAFTLLCGVGGPRAVGVWVP